MGAPVGDKRAVAIAGAVTTIETRMNGHYKSIATLLETISKETAAVDKEVREIAGALMKMERSGLRAATAGDLKKTGNAVYGLIQKLNMTRQTAEGDAKKLGALWANSAPFGKAIDDIVQVIGKVKSGPDVSGNKAALDTLDRAEKLLHAMKKLVEDPMNPQHYVTKLGRLKITDATKCRTLTKELPEYCSDYDDFHALNVEANKLKRHKLHSEFFPKLHEALTRLSAQLKDPRPK